MNGLMAKLRYIQEECGGGENGGHHEEDQNLDDFTRLKKRIAREIKQIRRDIQEREDLLSHGTNNPQTIQLSSNIRNQLKSVKDDAETLRTMHSEYEEKSRRKKKGGDPQEEALLSNRTEIVELAFKHIEECEVLEKGRNSTYYARAQYAPTAGAATVTSLPDIDDGDFAQIRQTDRKIDQELEEVSKGVAVLKDIAINMNREAQKQNMMIDQIDNKVEKANTQLQNLNKRLKDTLQKIRKGDRFIMDFILLCVVLAIGGVIYNMVS